LFTTQNKRVIVSVINDLVTDVRVKKSCDELVGLGYDVLLVGRKLPHSSSLPNWTYRSVRMNLVFTKGVLFYLFFNFRLFFLLLFRKADLLLANDLDTLLPNYLISKIKRIPLVYDSHELFCEVPELMDAPLKKKTWEWLEAWIVPKLKYAITVNQSIADVFNSKYGITFSVVRNIPPVLPVFHAKTKQELNMPMNKHIFILQGAGINVDRGAEELILAMKYIDNAVLYVIGSGDVWQDLVKLVTEKGLDKKVILIPKLPKEELLNYTRLADIGIAIDKDTNLNYRYSLPNKLFDYIHAEVPILASKMVEIENVIKKFDIGDFIDDHDPQHIAEKLNGMLLSPNYKKWKENLKHAKNVLTWDEEKKTFIQIIQSINT